jgi:hypothetical protein
VLLVLLLQQLVASCSCITAATSPMTLLLLAVFCALNACSCRYCCLLLRRLPLPLLLLLLLLVLLLLLLLIPLTSEAPPSPLLELVL